MAKQATSSLSYKKILNDIKQRNFVPVYLLMGEESYYIDIISDSIANNVLPEEERDFNQMVVYCTKETKERDIINMAKRYPMMSEFQVIIVKEAKNLLNIDELIEYVQNPLKSTILVICHKNGNVDKRKKLVSAISQVGVVFESPKLKDSALPAFITEYVNERNLKISSKALNMLAEHIGPDLSRLTGELEKLRITMPEGQNEITPEHIERNIGISRDYNIWEFKTAIINKDVFKANQIQTYFNSNPKANPSIPLVYMLFNLFADVMQAYYSPDKTPTGIANHLEIAPWMFQNNIMPAMRNYSPMKTMQIIAKLREADEKLKGIKTGNATDGEIMQELIYFILH